MRSRIIAVLLAAFVGGCGGVYSKHPLSDDTTSRDDDRLLGFWRAEEPTAPGAGASAPRDQTLLAIGRTSPPTKTLRLATMTLRKDRSVDTTLDDFLPTTIAGASYASVHLPGVEEGPAWVLFQYDVADADTLRVFAMDESELAADVRAGVLKGEVSESKATADAKPMLTVALEAPTPALRAYVEKRRAAVYRTDRVLVLHRVRVP